MRLRVVDKDFEDPVPGCTSVPHDGTYALLEGYIGEMAFDIVCGGECGPLDCPYTPNTMVAHLISVQEQKAFLVAWQPLGDNACVVESYFAVPWSSQPICNAFAEGPGKQTCCPDAFNQQWPWTLAGSCTPIVEIPAIGVLVIGWDLGPNTNKPAPCDFHDPVPQYLRVLYGISAEDAAFIPPHIFDAKIQLYLHQ
jgi:hypothetical protein